MPNILPVEQQILVLKLLVEGTSISSVSRYTGVHRDTVSRLMVRFGTACQRFLDRELRNLEIAHLQLDEIWTFCAKKQYRLTPEERNRVNDKGDIYIFVAFDEATRLVPAHRAGKRDQLNTNIFIHDLSARLKIPKAHESDAHGYRPGGYKPITRISTDGFAPYLMAIDAFFGPWASYGLIEKDVSGYGRNKTVEITPTIIKGEIAPKDVTTSLIERNNLTIRTFVKRMNRKTLAFSKKLANLRAATSMHFTYYNFCWKHKTLRTTPAVAAGVVSRPMKMRELYGCLRDGWPGLFL